MAIALGAWVRLHHLGKLEVAYRCKGQRCRVEAYVASLVATGEDNLDATQAYHEILAALNGSDVAVIANNRATWQIIDREFDRLHREYEHVPRSHAHGQNRQQMLDKAEALHQEADRFSALADEYHRAMYRPWTIVER